MEKNGFKVHKHASKICTPERREGHCLSDPGSWGGEGVCREGWTEWQGAKGIHDWGSSEAITSSQRERVCHARVLCKQELPSQQKGAGTKMKKTRCVARVAAGFIPTVEGKGAG